MTFTISKAQAEHLCSSACSCAFSQIYNSGTCRNYCGWTNSPVQSGAKWISSIRTIGPQEPHVVLRRLVDGLNPPRSFRMTNLPLCGRQCLGRDRKIARVRLEPSTYEDLLGYKMVPVVGIRESDAVRICNRTYSTNCISRSDRILCHTLVLLKP